MGSEFHLQEHGLNVAVIYRNLSAAELYEHAIHSEEDAAIMSSGALLALSGRNTGRAAREKRIVDEPTSHDDVWWTEDGGESGNIPLSDASFQKNRDHALAFLNEQPALFVVDAFAGWDPRYRIRVRVICTRPYHALFMTNMLIRPSDAELADFGTPDYVIYNAGIHPADTSVEGVAKPESVALSFARREMVILGTEYAGEMKKGVFSIMNYIMPKQGVLSMHCSANESANGDVSLFFGLSGTGKTTLSADPNRPLIGDDEHCWTEDGVFNIEGGCYAKVIDLTEEREPDIYRAIRFGSVLENVVYDARTREVDYTNSSITENTRGSYPLEFISNAKVPAVGSHPTNIIFLTCDAYGVLPPVSRLSPEQAMYHFISGYTAKVAGTETGVSEPRPTFSACFGAAFLVWHPARYAEMLADMTSKRGVNTWLVNTGWVGGKAGKVDRIRLRDTRAIIDAIHSGELAAQEFAADPIFGLSVPVQCPGVSSELLRPEAAWPSPAEYREIAHTLAELFRANFRKFEAGSSAAILSGGPVAR